jgi:16S rRNA (adenine1518-N6/adenine1519-N6)-dimethyltransferase
MEDNFNLKAKKSLGQNFLKSPKELAKIIRVADLQKGDLVLEIGPGKGSLTEKIIEAGAIVVAVEKDERMFHFLKEKFQNENSFQENFFIINDDILKLDTDQISQNENSFQKKYKIVANIPYYITGAIIRKFLEATNSPEKMVLLVQKEVGERIVAKNKKESLLSISVKAFCKPIYISTVKAKLFSPQPKVDSAIILFENIGKENFEKNKISEKLFFEILHAGFAHKRKILLKNLIIYYKKMGDENEIILADIFKKLNLNPKIRAENLSPEQWFDLVGEITVEKGGENYPPYKHVQK